MIVPAAIALFASSFTFTTLFLVFRSERRRSRRFLLSQFRGWLDVKLNSANSRLISGWNHFVKYILQLNWYYSIHSVLKMWLRVIVKLYTYFESVFESNREKTKKLRAEKREVTSLSGLQQMAEHKINTALTPSQKKKLRHKKLEEKH